MSNDSNDYNEGSSHLKDEKDLGQADQHQQFHQGEEYETYSEPQNDYYTAEYDEKNYFSTPEQNEINPDIEPDVFANQAQRQTQNDYIENDDVYATDLPNYGTDNHYSAYGQYAPAPPENAEPLQTDDYGDAQQPEQAYVTDKQYDDQTSEYNPEQQNTTSDQYLTSNNDYKPHDHYFEPSPYDEPEHENSAMVSEFNSQAEYSETSQFVESSQPVDSPHYVEEAVYDEQTHDQQHEFAPQQFDYVQNQQAEMANPAREEIYDDLTVGQQSGRFFSDDQQPHIDPRLAADISDDQVQPRVDSISPPQQDFRQEYMREEGQKKGLVSGKIFFGIAASGLLFLSFFVYNYFSSNNGVGEIPVILAKKTDLKIFPNTKNTIDNKVDTNKLIDRIGNTDVSNGFEARELPKLSDSRENVVEQPIKSEDRVEVSENVVVDNDDKDIQNVLTLLNSSANNVEILLKPDAVGSLDKNQININGLETNLVEAKPVKLNDLIQQAQANSTDIKPVKTASLDDLPVVGEGNQNPFKDVVEQNAQQLPEKAAQALPEQNPSITQIVNESVNLSNAPKPIKRPDVQPTIVPEVISQDLPPIITVANSGGYGVQLASLPNEAAARKAFVKISNQFSGLLAGYRAIIKEADVPNKGTFYRVFAGPLASYNEASQLCANLIAQGISGCFARKM